MIPEEQSGGITSLPRFYFTSNIIQHKEGLPNINDPNDIKCNICEKEDADSFCQDCQEFYCEGCQRGHKKGKATKSHKFISVDDGNSSLVLQILLQQYHHNLLQQQDQLIALFIHIKSSTHSARQIKNSFAQSVALTSILDTLSQN